MPPHPRREGVLIDFDTGVLRSGRLLVQRSDRAIVSLTSDRRAARVQRFAFGDTDDPDEFIAACRDIARAFERGDLVKTRQRKVPSEFLAIGDSSLRRLMIAEWLGRTNPGLLGKLTAIDRSEAIKASPDDPKHPGWPAGTPDGRGGKFRPKTAAEMSGAAQAAIDRAAFRRSARMILLEALSLSLTGASNLVPVLGEVADIAMIAHLAQTLVEFRQLGIDTEAARKFVESGPHTLAELRVSPDSEAFSSYGEFYKLLPPEAPLEKRFGRAGDGYQYHHNVAQGGPNAGNFSPEQLQSTDNIFRIPTLLHEAINSKMYAPAEAAPTLTLREWLEIQPFDVQYHEGIKLMQRLGLVRTEIDRGTGDGDGDNAGID